MPAAGRVSMHVSGATYSDEVQREHYVRVAKWLRLNIVTGQNRDAVCLPFERCHLDEHRGGSATLSVPVQGLHALDIVSAIRKLVAVWPGSTIHYRSGLRTEDSALEFRVSLVAVDRRYLRESWWQTFWATTSLIWRLLLVLFILFTLYVLIARDGAVSQKFRVLANPLVGIWNSVWRTQPIYTAPPPSPPPPPTPSSRFSW